MVRLGMMRWGSGLLLLWMVLACAGLTPPAEQGDACCSVDDIVRLTNEGVSDELIIATIRTSGTDLPLTAEDIVTLKSGNVSDEVVDVLNGGPCECLEIEEPEPVATGPKPRSKPKAAPKLKIAVKYSGGKSMEVVNLSKSDYTGVTLVVNDEYQYRLKKLKGNAGDFMRLSSFVSRRTGAEAKKVKMKKIYISADQGTYSRTF